MRKRYRVYVGLVNSLVSVSTVSGKQQVNKQGFHLQGNFLAEGNLDTCKENCKEIRLTRKWQGYFDVQEEMRGKLHYF